MNEAKAFSAGEKYSTPLQELLTGAMAAQYGVLPMIPLPRDEDLLIGFIEKMGTVLANKGIYRRDSLIMLPDPRLSRLNILEAEVFCSWAQEHVVNYMIRYDKNGEPFVTYKDMPTEIAKKTILSPRFREYLPEIKEVYVVPVPVDTADGGLKLLEAGFEDGKFVFDFCGINKCKISYDHLSLRQSTDRLRKVLREFPFRDWRLEVLPTGEEVWQSRSQAVQVVAMLSLFCMAMIPNGANRMGIIYNANSQRSGKTLLAKLAIMTNCGAFKAQSWKCNEADLNKVLDSELMAGSMYICFDNVRGYIGSQTLEGLMTAPHWTGRVLGRTQMFTAENRLNLFITGNDCMVSPDMSHRCLICDLFVEQGDVQERQVKNIIDEAWLMDPENRHYILSALWGLTRSWHEAGRPTASSFGYKPRLGFERWGEIIGGIVAHAGFGNPFEIVQLDSAGDSEERSIRKLIERLRDESLRNDEQTGREEYEFQQIVDFCHEDGLFAWMLNGTQIGNNYKLNAKSLSKFGIFIKKYFPLITKVNHVRRSYSVKYGVPTNDPKSPGERLPAVNSLHYVGSKGDGRHKRYFIEWKLAE